MDFLEFFYHPEAFAQGKINKTPIRRKIRPPSPVSPDEEEEPVPIVNPTKKLKVELPLNQEGKNELIHISEYVHRKEKHSFARSLILSAKVENSFLEKLKYSSIIKFIYEYIGDIDLVKNISILNIRDGKIREKGYEPIEELNISFQAVPADKSIKEIFIQVIENGIDFRMEIETFEGEKLIFVNYNYNSQFK